MTVATWLPSNFTTQSASTYKAAIDGDFAVAQRFVDNFAPRAAATPNMTVQLDAGHVLRDGLLTEVAAQTTPTFVAPSGNPRIDRVIVDRATGALSVVTGTPAATPVPPALPLGKNPVAQVLLQPATTAIANNMLTDERDLGSLGLGSAAFQSASAFAATLAMAAAINESFASILSAGTVAIGAAAANYLQVTGTTAITAFDTVQAGTCRTLEFQGALTLTNNATSLILPGGANITTAPGDVATFRSEGSGNWRCVAYARATGQSLAGSKIAQVVNTETGAVATGTTTMSVADAIPTNSQGDQYMSLAITPVNASSTLLIDVVMNLSSSFSSAVHLIAALFQDATVNALTAAAAVALGSGDIVQIVFRHKMTAGTVSSTTFKVRAGAVAAGTTTFNGELGSRVLGGVLASSITITEVLP
jgi:hypothetical protein